ncbi:MAG TPA: LysM peptidoglycan-binding domain-containing protein [Cyclobacteriaceae bacterium]|nr:LysM peptidoglycan-binding domain-containing protein [Cyclobacteriaceae bacterium]
MKFFAPALIFCGAAAFAQSPQVPHKMQFAGLTLTIRDDARREIQKDVDALTLHPKYFNIKVERAKTYFPIIEKIFAEERLPDDFKYLCLQESALVPDAVSSSNAVGFWQFKDFTAREMGLRVDDEIDERMNIASASRGAARYIKQCNHYFNNWVYALQAYQMGAGGVMRAVGDKDLGARHMEITMETYWYVRKYLAHKVAFENAVTGKPAQEVTHFYAGGRSIQEIAKEGAVEEERIREFNKWLKTDRIPMDKEYAVLIPHGPGTSDFGVLIAAAPKSTNVPVIEKTTEELLEINGIAVIRAIPGESLTAIAKRGNLSLQAFLHNNDMTIDRPIRAGELYFLHKKKKRAAQELYTLKPGDDVWTVSQRFGVQQKSLLKFNALQSGSTVVAGTTLYLSSRKPGGNAIIEEDETIVAEVDEDATFNWDQPLTSGTASLHATPRDADTGYTTADARELQTRTPAEVHEVKSTDTLYSVARQYGVTIKDLMEWNGKKDFSLSVGEKLKVRAN